MSENSSGNASPSTPWGDFNRIDFLVRQALARVQTATLVRIVSVANVGGVEPVGLVDVLPLVNQLDAQGNAIVQATIHNVPYARLQGGANAIIIDPQAGDIGICLFASRDLSKVKATKAAANPGSFRQHSFADGLYVGGVLNGTPSQYVRFSTAGVEIHSPAEIKLTAPTVEIDCQTLVINATSAVNITTPKVTITGKLDVTGPTALKSGATVTGSISATVDVMAAGVSSHDHKHGGITRGTGITDAPT